MVVAVGETPSAPVIFTDPTPGVRLTLVAPVVVHASVVDVPATMDEAVAVNVAVGSDGGGGGGAAVTVTVAVAVTAPVAFVAVTV